jgi:oligosaccharide translocation protein RFT1
MTIFSLIYACSAFTLYRLQLGDLALVYANIINLSTRIAYSVYFIEHYFHSCNSSDLLKWSHVWPSWKLCFAASLSAMLIWYNDSAFSISRIVQDQGVIAFIDFHVVSHLALGVSLALLCIFVWLMTSDSVLILKPQKRNKIA